MFTTGAVAGDTKTDANEVTIEVSEDDPTWLKPVEAAMVFLAEVWKIYKEKEPEMKAKPYHWVYLARMTVASKFHVKA